MPLTPRQRDMYEKFSLDNPYCWACGIEPDGARKRSKPLEGREPLTYFRNLENAHIVGGYSLVHDVRVLARLCKMCHDLSHRLQIPHPKTKQRYLPLLRCDHLLWLKYRHEGAPIDRQFIRDIRVSRVVPAIYKPPTWFRKTYEMRRGPYPESSCVDPANNLAQNATRKKQ